ncbi:uncharacterized protein LOC111364562 [Spodoptera litura]|uniref:Uncharacterized protein LOC111364562 n=1 Tax=Spodoptera litura TaxID=69820 RepID=A0A9J7ETJ1_SPOLT|nr:uncharacterized protein LOC111364562 [Spodoptera litura]XP_022837245.1 uncharacterized protein LOC111364562 [Spodoptera litura]
MTNKAYLRIGTMFRREMARVLLLMMAVIAMAAGASTSDEEVALANITRSASGDYFSLKGSDCGPTRCMEASHGTALSAIGGAGDSGCRCQCRRDTPAFREDQHICVNHIDECLMASFGRGATKPQIPFVFLPLKGQIIYPSKEIIFTDVEDAICAVTSAQYLSPSGWVTLRDLIDNDVPFGLYRDEGSTFLQWRGSATLHARLEGRLVAAHVLCSSSTPSRLVASCAAFRIAGATQNALLDVRSIPFHAGELITSESTSQNQGLSVLEALAIGVCVLLLIFVYAAGIIFYVHYKQRQKRKEKDPEQNHANTMSTDNGSMESRIDMSNVMLKTNPLLKLNGMSGDFLHDTGFSDGSERNEDTLDSSSNNTHTHNSMHKFQKLNANSVISAMVHSRRKKTLRPSIRNASSPEPMNERVQRRSASPDTLERAPHSELSIVDCTMENNNYNANRQLPPSNGDSSYRKKLYFNPVFFETELLKNPPPAAIEFLIKIREVMSVAKEKMTSKRFIPILSDIPEEDMYHAVDLGWDIPCARRGRRFSAISLKQENSRKTAVCGGCPGCDSKAKPHKVALTRSNSCKSCVSEDYKQRIVRKWLDEVPLPTNNAKPMKSVAKVNGTPRVVEPPKKEEPRPKSDGTVKNETTKPKITETKLKAEKKSKIIETKPKVSESKPKTTDTKPKVTEIIAKENMRDIDSKENFTKELNLQEMKIISKPINPKEIEIIRVTTVPDLNGLNNLVNINEADKIPKPATPTPPQEKKSPSSHTSRRIRKKLPPPPPPPAVPPELPKGDDEEAPIPPEVKVKMEAVIRELNTCRRVEPIEIEEMKLETIAPIAPKIVIPVIAADNHYYSDDNTLSTRKKKQIYGSQDNFMEFDSLERNMLKRRRFSVACGPELFHNDRFEHGHNLLDTRERLTSSWLDVKKAENPPVVNQIVTTNEVFIQSMEPTYNNLDDLSKPGPLTIQVRGSPIESRRNYNKDDFDPDTLDRRDTKKRVEKILLKSAGSFKYKSTSSESESCRKSPIAITTRKIGNLRQIYEAKAKAQEEEMKFYSRRGSVTYGQDLSAFIRSGKTPDLIRHIEGQKDPKPPIPPKQRRGSEFYSSTRESPPGDRRRMLEDRDKFSQYTRLDNLNARRSGRRSARTRSRRTDIRKLYRTEDSGYMSTDSNESKCRARYLMQLRPVKTVVPDPIPVPATRTTIVKTSVLQIESDTDDLESLCDGRSESGGESVETDSVFFGNFDDSKEMFAELGLSAFEPQNKMMQSHEQIDSGFMGETNIILSGDSDSEHRSVISIMTGHDGRASAASISKLDEAPYMHTIEC